MSLILGDFEAVNFQDLYKLFNDLYEIYSVLPLEENIKPNSSLPDYLP